MRTNQGERYMAYNHNGTELMLEPGTKAQATREAENYSIQTGNNSYVDLHPKQCKGGQK